MQFVSPLVSRIGALTGSGTPEPADAARVVPNAYLGILPFPNQFIANLGDTFADSFVMSAGDSITNTGGGLTFVDALFVPGIWQLAITFDAEFNWLDANPLQQDARLFFRPDASLPINQTLVASAARISRTVIRLESITFCNSKTASFGHILNGNGVGQTSTINFQLSANRLL